MYLLFLVITGSVFKYLAVGHSVIFRSFRSGSVFSRAFLKTCSLFWLSRFSWRYCTLGTTLRCFYLNLYWLFSWAAIKRSYATIFRPPKVFLERQCAYYMLCCPIYRDIGGIGCLLYLLTAHMRALVGLLTNVKVRSRSLANLNKSFYSKRSVVRLIR